MVAPQVHLTKDFVVELVVTRTAVAVVEQAL
jgi:hypothetical protein